MNSYERIKRAMEHKEADRIPIFDDPWAGTLRRWKNEGMPSDMHWADYFGVDKIGEIGVDISPRLEVKIIEDNEKYQTVTTKWGVTMRKFKQEDSTPEMLDFKIIDRDTWEDAKKRMTLDDDRVNWARIKELYPLWRSEGRWVRANFWFGFDVTHSWMMGTENLLIAMMEDEELVMDMFDTYLDRCEKLFARIWDAGYRFDCIRWPDDMGYKGTSFFSAETYRKILKPYHTRAVQWAHDRGIYAELHSCGNIMGLLDDVIETGIDCLNPLEVKAGMDAIGIKEKYGAKIALRGGIDASKWNKTDEILAEIYEKVPKLKQNGGFIFSSDHSIPNDVTLENMKKIVAAVKECGSY